VSVAFFSARIATSFTARIATGLSSTNPAARAVHMVLAMRERLETLTVKWRKQGFDLGLGAGIAQGYATIGAVGFEGRWDYGAIGTVTNLAARLCSEAKPGQILVSKRVAPQSSNLSYSNRWVNFSSRDFSSPSAPSM
jgi:adenylate cyclase